MSNLTALIAIAFLLGMVTGLRSMLALAGVSWAARLGLMNLAPTPLAFLGYAWTPYILTLFAIGELIGDKLPKTPSRKALVPFIGRVVLGALVGAAVGLSGHSLIPGLIAGVAGAVSGTLGGATARARLAAAFGRDLPAALVEDAVAVILTVILITRL